MTVPLGIIYIWDHTKYGPGSEHTPWTKDISLQGGADSIMVYVGTSSFFYSGTLEGHTCWQSKLQYTMERTLTTFAENLAHITSLLEDM